MRVHDARESIAEFPLWNVRMDLFGRLPELHVSIGSLVNLEELSLARNFLVALPEEGFSRLRRLRKLDVSRNVLTHLPWSLLVELRVLSPAFCEGGVLSAGRSSSFVVDDLFCPPSRAELDVPQ